jgi:acetyl-CoA acetyltransferase
MKNGSAASCCHAIPPWTYRSGPIPASRAALKKAGWKTDDLDLVEANEAFFIESPGQLRLSQRQ